MSKDKPFEDEEGKSLQDLQNFLKREKFDFAFLYGDDLHCVEKRHLIIENIRLLEKTLEKVPALSIPDEILSIMIGFYMWNQDIYCNTKTDIEYTIQSVFMMHASENAKLAMKGNWKLAKNIGYAIPNAWDSELMKAIHQFFTTFKSQGGFPPQVVLERTIKQLDRDLKDNMSFGDRFVMDVLGEIGDKRAVAPLIEFWESLFSFYWDNDVDEIQYAIAQALGNIGDKRAVDPLINSLPTVENDLGQLCRIYSLGSVVIALGNLGDKRAIIPLINTLEASFIAEKREGEPHDLELNRFFRRAVIEALGKFNDKRAIKTLFKTFTVNSSPHDGEYAWDSHYAAAKVLNKMGEPVVEYLIKAYTKDYDGTSASDSLNAILHTYELENNYSPKEIIRLHHYRYAFGSLLAILDTNNLSLPIEVLRERRVEIFKLLDSNDDESIEAGASALKQILNENSLTLDDYDNPCNPM